MKLQLSARPPPATAHGRVQSISNIRCAASPRVSPAPKPAKLDSTRQHLEHSLEQRAARTAPTQGVDHSSASQAEAPAQLQASARQKGRQIILLDGDCLESTTEHRAIVGAGLAMMGSLLAVGASQAHDIQSATAAVAAAASGYILAGEPCTTAHAATSHGATVCSQMYGMQRTFETPSVHVSPDLLSGVYHWGVDNYGDGNTPVFGSQIAGFQVWTRSTSAQHRMLTQALFAVSSATRSESVSATQHPLYHVISPCATL